MSSTTSQAPYYYVPEPSRHPVRASIGLLAFGLGMSQWVNGHDWAAYLTFAGVVWVLFVLYQWFGDAIRESESGLNSVNVDVSYRWSMSWFIFSETSLDICEDVPTVTVLRIKSLTIDSCSVT